MQQISICVWTAQNAQGASKAGVKIDARLACLRSHVAVATERSTFSIFCLLG